MELHDEQYAGFKYYEPSVNEYRHIRKGVSAVAVLFVILAALLIVLVVAAIYYPTVLADLLS